MHVCDNMALQDLFAPHVLQLDVSQCHSGLNAHLTCCSLRSSFGLVQNIMCKIVGTYVAINFIVMEIFYFGVWCRPFRDAWLTPTPISMFVGFTEPQSFLIRSEYISEPWKSDDLQYNVPRKPIT